MWQPIETAPEGIPVWTMISDAGGVRNEQIMTYKNNLWWAGEIYVYYQPTHWKGQ